MRCLSAGTRRWPAEFGVTATVHDPKVTRHGRNVPPAQPVLNPQTTTLCEFLDITNPCAAFLPSAAAAPGREDSCGTQGVTIGAPPPPPLGRPGPPSLTTSATLSLPPPSAFPAAVAALMSDPNMIDIDDDDDSADDVTTVNDPNAIMLDEDDDSADDVITGNDSNAIVLDGDDDVDVSILGDGKATASNTSPHDVRDPHANALENTAEDTSADDVTMSGEARSGHQTTVST